MDMLSLGSRRVGGRRASGPGGALAAMLCVVLTGAIALGRDLSADLTKHIKGSKLGDAVVGLSVMDLESGRVMASFDDRRRDDQPGRYIPASNMKLLTSGAAILVLGPGFRFTTELAISGDTLILIGSGDPALADPELLERMEPRRSVEDLLRVLTTAVTGAGVRTIREVVVDDGIFDREMVHPGWPKDHQVYLRYCAGVSGLNFHANVLSVFASPGAGGDGARPVVRLEPRADWLQLDVQAKTVAQGGTRIGLRREGEDERFVITGQVRGALEAPEQVTVCDPAMLAGQILADRLRQAGVKVGVSGDAISAVRRRDSAESFASTRTLAVISTSIRDVLQRCNTDSYNLYAESLIKRMGAEVTGEPGSWKNGASVLRMTLTEQIGAEQAAQAVVSDGSGLSRDNRVTPSLMTTWLASMSSTPKTADLFIDSLASPGSGPLRRRFLDKSPSNDLRAKTGYINGVRALSGYLTNQGTGRRIAFSILINDLRLDETDANARKLQETLVLELDKWLTMQERLDRAEVGG